MGTRRGFKVQNSAKDDQNGEKCTSKNEFCTQEKKIKE